MEKIIVKGARAHNLKNIDVEIPRGKLVVLTGLSGSGKSSLAFDTIYAEGQRRYVESLSAYARQFLGQMEKPDVDAIEGLSPAISIDQKTTSRNPRSTVGTVTEIYDYLRLLFARIGRPVCPTHGIEIQSQTIEQMVDRLLAYPERTKMQILAPIVSGKKGTHAKTLEDIRKQGYVRVRIDGEMRELTEDIELEKNKKHSIDVVVDRVVIKDGIASRLADSLETALKLADGKVVVDVIGEGELLFSEKHACPYCGFSIGELEPRLFSFNSPFGACPDCDGLGVKLEVDLDLVIPNDELTLKEHAIAPWEPQSSQYYPQLLEAVCRHYGIPMDVPVKELPKEQLAKILYGSGGEPIYFRYTNDFGQVREQYIAFEGVVRNIERRYRETSSDYIREQMEKYMAEQPCPTCQGYRLKKESLAVLVGGKHIGEVTAMSVTEALAFFDGLELTEKEAQIARLILREIRDRLGFLQNVGLDYLTLSRSAGTLSGGEAQRIRLATQIGSRLTGVLYVLDEPSIGLP
ncbi:excinuclease ABC subunit UvrA, partial [Geobacillus stearothermophilus]|uniref:excinuclease ABC subunit UvrA n=1 Tax=Geobacillus stearothermophilus TaxID=1422 RepID=UPI002E244C28